MDPAVVLKGVLPSVAAALLLVSLAGVRLLPLAAALGLFVAHVLLKGWPALPTALVSAPNGIEWLLWVTGAAALIAVLEHCCVLTPRIAGGLAVVAAGLGTGLVLQKVAAQWSAGEVWLQVGVGGFAVALLALGHRAVLARAPRGALPALLFTVALSLDALLLVLGRSVLLGQLAGALAAALGAGLGTRLWRRPFALGNADGTWLGIAHGAFLLAGVHLAYLPWPAAALALVAPLLPLLLGRRFASRSAAWAAAAAALVLLPLLAAVWLAATAGDQGY